MSDREQEELARYTRRVLDALASEEGGIAPFTVAYTALAMAAGTLMRMQTYDVHHAAVLIKALAQTIAAGAEQTALELAKEGRT